MNSHEKIMLDILKELKTNLGAVAVRAEFETEGTRLEELLRLKEITTRAGLGLTLKIGGCESIRDLLEARIVGISDITAPMIESDFAAKKFVQAVTKVYRTDELSVLGVWLNIETKMGVSRAPQILACLDNQKVKGIIVERVDLCHSVDLDADAINSPRVCEMVQKVLVLAKSKGLKTTVAGGVSMDSYNFFRSLPDGLLDRFETRKVTFEASLTLSKEPQRAIVLALAFELFYLKNKMSFFRPIKNSDLKRLNVLETRYWQQINRAIT
jgi:hypothetical protein